MIHYTDPPDVPHLPRHLTGVPGRDRHHPMA